MRRVLRSIACAALVAGAFVGTIGPASPAQWNGASWRRMTVTFSRSSAGSDAIVVRYYPHGQHRAVVYTCLAPNEQFRYYTEGFTETWASGAPCTSAGARPEQMRATFATNYTSPNFLYLRVTAPDAVAYEFSCEARSEATAWTPSVSSDSRLEQASLCHLDRASTRSIDNGAPQPTPPPLAPGICGSTAAPPATYQHLVVIMLENRTWPDVGGPGFGAMPYTHQFAQQCTSYAQWLDTNPHQDSLPQYIGLTSGVDNPPTYADCVPSTTCRSTDDNIFRQVRDAGGTARTYVEGATTGCDGSKHPANVPALYYFGGNDHSFCTTEVRPATEMNVDALPTFAMIIPSRCSNGHSCPISTVDSWLKRELTTILGGASYRGGRTAVFVLYDEDRPMPNLIIAPTAHTGLLTRPIASHSDALKTFDEMLGLPVLPAVRSAVSLRASAHM
jgi:hypothetical protein